MSLRDFNSPSDDPIALHNSPQGNGNGLGNFHTINPEEREPNNTPKIVGALAVALMVGAAGIGLYAYSGSPSNKQVVTASNMPASSTPAPVAAPAPQAAAMTPEPAATPADNTPAPIAPVKSASAKPSRSMSTASSVESDAGAAAAGCGDPRAGFAQALAQ